MNQGENAPPLHPRCRCTIVATFDSPGKRGKTSGERAARDENGRRTRVPADMTYKDWRAVYIDKSKTFDAWQKEMEAKYAAMPPTREQLRGREIIDKLSSGLPVETRNDKIKFQSDIQRFAAQRIPEGDYNLTIRRQVQNRHIEGTREYQDYVTRLSEKNLMPSKILSNVDVQVLVREFHGKGLYDPNPKDNSPREYVDTGRIIGQYWDRDIDEFVDTTWIEIVYSKRGTHVYPVRPPKEG